MVTGATEIIVVEDGVHHISIFTTLAVRSIGNIGDIGRASSERPVLEHYCAAIIDSKLQMTPDFGPCEDLLGQLQERYGKAVVPRPHGRGDAKPPR